MVVTKSYELKYVQAKGKHYEIMLVYFTDDWLNMVLLTTKYDWILRISGTFECIYVMQLLFSKCIKCIVGPSVEVAAVSLWNNLSECNLQWMLSDYKNRNYSQFCNSINAWKTTISEYLKDEWRYQLMQGVLIYSLVENIDQKNLLTEGSGSKPTRRTKMILVDVTKTRTTQVNL